MEKRSFYKGGFFMLLLLVALLNSSWGFWGHKKINRLAIETLPEPLKAFYEKHADFIEQHATDPDTRRKTDKQEGMRHYIDADHYGTSPFDNIPRTWKEAVKKYSADTLNKYGINPWHIEQVMLRLTKAFKEKNTDSILSLSADLGHYVADAHVPLHSTSNYDGQLTGQKGIHALWESRIPELYGDNYKFSNAPAVYLKKPLDAAWDILKGSYACVDSVLAMDKKVSEEIPADLRFVTDSVDHRSTKTYTKAYTERYNQLLNGMVERRMQASITDVGSFWYTAWVNAGKPELEKEEKKN